MHYRFVIACPAEAKPLIKYYDLKLIKGNSNLFSCYKNRHQNIWLVVSGIGNINSAAATVFLYNLSPNNKKSIWVNLGTAGHFSEQIGKIFNIKKVIFKNSKKEVFYTNSIINSKFDNFNACSVFSPEHLYRDKNYLYEMEAYGFIKTVEKFCERERICILKVISDNYGVDHSKIKSLTYDLISKNINDIDDLLAMYFNIQTYEEIDVREVLLSINSKYRLSFYNKTEILKILKKLNIDEKKEDILKELKNSKSLKDMYVYLNRLIKNKEIDI